jgi:hypothetical protein
MLHNETMKMNIPNHWLSNKHEQLDSESRNFVQHAFSLDFPITSGYIRSIHEGYGPGPDIISLLLHLK